MLFQRRFHPGIIDGSITLTFRAWKRPQARPGGRYRLGAEGAIEVTSVTRQRLDAISDADARAAGFVDRAALLSLLRGLDAGDEVFRVAFRYVPAPDERAALARNARLSADDARAIEARLARMDARSANGSWTRRTLELIERRPRTVASSLASQLGIERLPFKANVRKLKALGLTISHDVGYELSPRGRAYLRLSREP